MFGKKTRSEFALSDEVVELLEALEEQELRLGPEQAAKTAKHFAGTIRKFTAAKVAEEDGWGKQRR